MKRKKTIILLFLLLLALGVVAFISLSDQSGFVGNRTATPDSYCLEMERMTGEDRHTLQLKAGDILQIQFEAVKGSVYLELKSPGGTTLYAGNGKEVTGFTVNISESGTYSVYVEAHHAKGTVHIQQRAEKRDAS